MRGVIWNGGGERSRATRTRRLTIRMRDDAMDKTQGRLSTPSSRENFSSTLINKKQK